MKKFKIIILGLLLGFAMPFPAQASTIVVSIPPIASAIKPLLGENDHVIVLLPSQASPHHFTLKPSMLVSIQQADLLISVGLGVDGWAQKAFNNQKQRSQTAHLVWSKQPNIHLLKAVDLLNISSKKVHEHEQAEAHHHDKGVDPHIWWDVDNVKALVKAVASQPNIHFSSQLAMILQQLTQVDKASQKALLKVRHTPFLTVHPGFHYFEHRYGLRDMGSVQVNEAGTSIQRILALRKQVAIENIQCIFSTVDTSPKLIDNIAPNEEETLKVVVLNPMGNANQTTVEVMTQLTQQYLSCLQR